MDTGFEYEKLLHRLKIGLPGQIRVITPTVSCAVAKCDRVQFVPDGTIVKQLFDFAIPWLKAKVFVNHESHARILDDIDKCANFVDAGRKRLLTNHRYLAIGKRR